MKDKLRIFWDAIVALISKVSYDKLLHFAVGMLIAAVCAIPFHAKAPLVFVVCVAFLKEAFDEWTTKSWDWWDFGATCIGGAIIQILIFLA